MKTQSSADSITTSHSPAHQRGHKNLTSFHQNASTSHTLHEAHTSYWTNVTHEGRNQKEERIQPLSLGKGDLKHSKIGGKKEKTEKY